MAGGAAGVFAKGVHGGGTPRADRGPLGPDRTSKQVQQRAYWVAWGKDVERLVRACPQCACYSRAEAPRQGLMQVAPVGEPWERVAIDITGPHPASKTGNQVHLHRPGPLFKVDRGISDTQSRSGDGRYESWPTRYSPGSGFLSSSCQTEGRSSKVP